jgi:hypothetical protein
MEGCGLERCCSFAGDVDMKGGSKVERRLKEEVRQSCGPKTGQKLLEEKQNIYTDALYYS